MNTVYDRLVDAAFKSMDLAIEASRLSLLAASEGFLTTSASYNEVSREHQRNAGVLMREAESIVLDNKEVFVQ